MLVAVEIYIIHLPKLGSFCKKDIFNGLAPDAGKSLDERKLSIFPILK